MKHLLDVPEYILKDIASITAHVVRNEMEDFHVKNLTDDQMKELNPIIRNAIYTAIYALKHYDRPYAEAFLHLHEIAVPSYWERPQLTDELLRSSEPLEEVLKKARG
jgi:hypothetical protein